MASLRTRPAILLTVIAAASALLLTAVTGVWLWTTADMARQLDAWEAAQRQAGLLFTHAPATRAGWPFAAELVLPDAMVTAKAPGPDGSVAWQAAEVTLRITPSQPGVLSIVPSGTQRLLGAGFDAPVTAARLEARIPLSGGPATVEAYSLALALPGGRLAADRLSLVMEATHAALSARDVMLPISGLPFGGAIASVALHGATNVKLPASSDLRSEAAAWQAAGGRIALDRAELHWGPLEATGAGTLTLDAALQPVATASLHLAGYDPLIAALERSDAISHGQAQVATTLLGLMAQTQAGGAPTVDLPLTLQDGRLMVGAIPIARMPHLSLP